MMMCDDIFTLPETNIADIAPENQRLEDAISFFWDGLFSGAMSMLVSGRVYEDI